MRNSLGKGNLIRYRGVDDVRRSFVLKNLKASWRAVLGLSAVALIGASYGVRQANNHIHGSSRTGGSFLAVSTRNTDEDLEYNREFQRMKYLSVPGTTGQSTTDGYVLADLGLKETNLPAGEFRKRAPHYKYY